MYDILTQTLATCDPGSCQIALAAVFRALLPPDVGTVYGSRVSIFMTRLNALGAAGRAVAGITSPKTALIRTSSPAKNSSFAASSPAAAAIATKGRDWPSAADITDDKLGAASPWGISKFTTPADVVSAVSSSSFLPCWSAPIPFYVYENKPVIDGGFSTNFGHMCAASLNGTAPGTECVRVAASGILGPYVKAGNDDKSGRSCELPKKRRRKSSSLRKMLQMGVLPKAALAAEDAWLSEIDRSMAAEYPLQAPSSQQVSEGSESSSGGGGSGDGAGEGATSSSAASAAASAASADAAAARASAQAAAAIDAAAEASAVSQQSDPSLAPPPPLPRQPRLNPLTESLTTLSFAVASAVSNATAGAAVPAPTLPETTPLCPKKEAATYSWPRLVNQTEEGGSLPSIYPGKFAASPLPFTVCEWQKLVLNLTPAVLPEVYAAGLADAAEWAAANGFCGASAGK